MNSGCQIARKLNANEKEETPKTKVEDIEALMQEGVSETLKLAKGNGVTLDFSDKSIREVEKLLGGFHRDYKKSKSEYGYHGLAIMCGAYIGAVIKRKGFGGSWSRNHPDMGEDTFPFHWRGSDLFLYAWCAKRIFDGSEDNVCFKYQTFVLDRLKQKPKKFNAANR